jgi:hypothetical protein
MFFVAIVNFVFSGSKSPPAEVADTAQREVEGYERSSGEAPKKTRLFRRRVACILIFLVQSHAPPPFEEDIIITTTTIIMEATEVMILYVLFFNMKDVCFINIHPSFQKKNTSSNYFLNLFP